MHTYRSVALALAGVLTIVHTASAAFYAESVIQYTPGAGVSASYLDPASALGEPSRITPGQYGGPVDPFSPPYLGSQLVSVGAGGSLTLQLGSPAVNDPANPFGVDFLILGNTGFWVTNEMDTNFNFIGTPATDGEVLGQNVGTTRVSVSADNITYYILNPALAPTVDGLYPTDGSGDFQRAVNPALGQISFAGMTLDAVRGLYAGSGGGAGFDLAWAQDAQGQPVALDSAEYVRVEVLSGKSEIDGLAVVPEPGTWTLLVLGSGLGVMLLRRRR